MWTTSGTFESGEHYIGTSAGVKRCKLIWRRPGKARWASRTLDECVETPWAPTPATGATARAIARTHTVVSKAVQHALNKPKCTAPNALNFSKRFPAKEDPAAAKAEVFAARKAQASSSSSAPAGVPFAGSTALDVPVDVGSPAPWARQDEVSAVEGTSNSACATQPMEGVVVAAEHENKRQRTVSRLLTIHEPEHGAAPW